MKILMTGGNGFIGSNIVKNWLGRHEFFLVTNESKGQIYQKGLLYEESQKVKYIHHDLTESFEALKLPSIDCVIHLAQGNQKFPDGALTEFKVNTVSTLELLEFARNNKVKKFIYASTAGIYGFGPDKFKETDLPRSKNFYEGTKIAAESLIWQYQQFFDCIITRFCFPYGPGVPPQRLFARLISNVLDNKEIIVKNDGMPKINPIYVDDLVEAMEKLLNRDGSAIINLGGQKTYTIKQIAQKIGTILGEKPIFSFEKDKDDSQHLVCSIELAKKLISFEPKVDLEEGLKRMIYKK